MNYDLDIPNKEHQLQGNRDPGTVFTLNHFAKSTVVVTLQKVLSFTVAQRGSVSLALLFCL